MVENFKFGGALVYGFAQGFTGFEMRYALGWNGHGGAAARIAAHAWSAVVDGKTAKATDFNAIAAHECIADGVQQGFDGVFGVAVRELAEAGGKLFDEIGSGHNKMYQ